MFDTKDIADYYNQTIDHYRIWWNMKHHLSVHYGYWDDATPSFGEALKNTNRVMAAKAGIRHGDKVLDAGCGVGGTAFFLASTLGAFVEGITLSSKQLLLAQTTQQKLGMEKQVHFSIQNFMHTHFPAHHFDVYWACESSCYATDKAAFIAEARRVLKPGGRLVVADYFLTEKGKLDEKGYMKKWGDLWAINQFHTKENFLDEAVQQGFTLLTNENGTASILKSARRMYHAYWAGMLPSMVYNLLHKTSHFNKNHYQSGKYQYKALQSQLWEYRIAVLQIPAT